MCDYSLHSVASRPAKVGDKLVTTKFAFTTYANNPGVTNAATANGISPSAALSGPLPHARWAKNPGN